MFRKAVLLNAIIGTILWAFLPCFSQAQYLYRQWEEPSTPLNRVVLPIEVLSFDEPEGTEEAGAIVWSLRSDVSSSATAHVKLVHVFGKRQLEFRVNSATASDGSNCEVSDLGWHQCSVDLDWKTGKEYRLKIEKASKDSWTGSVLFDDTEVVIGTIFATSDQGGLTKVRIQVAEVSPRKDTCSSYPSTATLLKPPMYGDQDVIPDVKFEDSDEDGACAGRRWIADLPDSDQSLLIFHEHNDVDECALLGERACGKYSKCTDADKEPGFTCACKNDLHPDSGECLPPGDCRGPTHACDLEKETCTEKDGEFRCECIGVLMSDGEQCVRPTAPPDAGIADVVDAGSGSSCSITHGPRTSSWIAFYAILFLGFLLRPRTQDV